MKALSEITFGFSDAENYKRRESKELFDKIFLKTEALEDIFKPSTYFLIGEKGTGKTAYAVHLSNNNYKNTACYHKFIRETDYLKFIRLKKIESLTVSDYVDIWKVILLMIISKEVSEDTSLVSRVYNGWKFGAVRKAIASYYSNAFSPEIPQALKFVEDARVSASTVAKYVAAEAEIKGEVGYEQTVDSQKFQIQLAYLERQFSDAIQSVKFDKNHTLFIDGIDIRPDSVSYVDYIECVKGMVNAAWQLNNDIFPSAKDSKGRIKIVLLLRPDIFNSLGLVNRNTKLKDNSVVLRWYTRYAEHRDSDIFKMSDRMFSAQQDTPVRSGDCWDTYFPFDVMNLDKSISGYSSFVGLLRYSLHRPRDILTMLDILHELFVRDDPQKVSFSYEDFNNREFKHRYSDYFLGEIKDALSFYYRSDEFEDFFKFFEFLDGKHKFTYEKYIDAYESFADHMSSSGRPLPEFMKSADEFLQFLFEQNVIAYLEDAEEERFIHWCFIERTNTNVAPKVKVGAQYEIHYALGSALNLGKEVARRKGKIKEDKGHSGIIRSYFPKKNFGFISASGLPVEIFFHSSAVVGGADKVQAGKNVRLVLEKDKAGRLRAKSVILL